MTNTESLNTLKKAQALLNTAVEEEQRWGEGDANYIVFENAERMVVEYESAIEQGVINNEPIIVEETNANLKRKIGSLIYLLNNGSDNAEYLRGQVELAMYLLDYTPDNEHSLRAELEGFAQKND